MEKKRYNETPFIPETIRYYSLSPADFIIKDPFTYASDWGLESLALKNEDAAFGGRTFYAPLHLPHDSKIYGLKFFYYRDDALSLMSCALERVNCSGAPVSQTLASVISSSTAGNAEQEDTTIDNAVVDNQNYFYRALCFIGTNDSVDDAYLKAVVISYLVVKQLP